MAVLIYFLQSGKSKYAPLAQLVEQLTLNQWVWGSSPQRCTYSGEVLQMYRLWGFVAFSFYKNNQILNSKKLKSIKALIFQSFFCAYFYPPYFSVPAPGADKPPLKSYYPAFCQPSWFSTTLYLMYPSSYLPSIFPVSSRYWT